MSRKEKTRNVRLWKVLVSIEMLAAYVALWFTHMSLYEDASREGSPKFVYENIGVGAMIFYIVFGLVFLHRFSAYWPLINKKDLAYLDERQLLVRKRVYERSYRLFAIFGVLSVVWFNYDATRMTHMLWWFAGSTYILLPVLVAAWQKDS